MTDYTAQDALNEMRDLATELEGTAEAWSTGERTDDVTRARAASLGMAAHKIRYLVRNIERAEGLA